jgi:hypothetical protein
VSSIYQKVLGSDFKKLHPMIQRRFGFCSRDGIASIGKGTMHKVWHGRAYTLPFQYEGTWRRIMFPETAANVPFSIENYAYLDKFGRETVTWIRTFHTKKRRRFDAYMIYSGTRKRIVDYLGTHQHLAVDLNIWVNETGGLCLRSGEQRFYEVRIAFKFPLIFSGIAEVCESYDESSKRFEIKVNVSNAAWGPLFGYHGTFEVDWLPMSLDRIPQKAKPLREEIRE